MDIRDFLLQSLQANQEIQTEVFAKQEEIKQNVEYFQPLFEIILDPSDSLSKAAESLWSKLFSRFYDHFVQSEQISEIKANILQILQTETVSLSTREKLILDVLRRIDEGVKEWPELFEFIAQTHGENINMLNLSLTILTEIESCLIEEELAQLAGVFVTVLTASAGVDDKEINTKAALLLSKMHPFVEDDLSPFFEKYFAYFQQLFAESPEDPSCFRVAESIAHCFNRKKTFFDMEKVYSELCGMIQPDNSPWIPIYVLAHFVKNYGLQLTENFEELVQASFTCAISIVENAGDEDDELESHVDFILKLPYKCMRSSKGHEFLDFLIPSLPTDSDAELYVSLQLLREIMGYAMDSLPTFLPTIVQIVEKSFESEAPLVLKAAYTCAGDIASYTNSFYNLDPLFSMMVQSLCDIVTNIDSAGEDAVALSDVIVQYTAPFLAYGNNLSQDKVLAYIQSCTELASREVHLVSVLYGLATAFEAYDGADEVAEQLLQLATAALESDECKAPALELIGTLIAKSPSVVPLSTIEVINEVFTQPELSIDLLIAAYTGLVKIVLAKLEGSEEAIMQFVMLTVGLLSKDSFLGEANSGSAECRNIALCFLDAVANSGIEIEEQLGDALLAIASGYSACDDDETYKVSMPLIFRLEVNQNTDYDEDLQSAIEQCNGSKERVSASLFAIEKLIKSADDILPEHIASIYEVCINTLSRNLPSMVNEKTEDSYISMDDRVTAAVECLVGIAKFYRDAFPLTEYVGFIQEHVKACSSYEVMLVLAPLVTFCQEQVDPEQLAAIFQIGFELSQSYNCTTPPTCISLMRACAIQDAASFSEPSLSIVLPILRNENDVNQQAFYQQAACTSAALIFSLSRCSEVPVDVLSEAISGISVEGTKEDIEICLISICQLAENSSEVIAQLQPKLLPTLQELNVIQRKFHGEQVSDEIKAATQQLIAALSGEQPSE